MPDLWAENKILHPQSYIWQLTSGTPDFLSTLRVFLDGSLSSPNFKHTCLFMPISKTQHYYVLGRSTFWWPRSQNHFNVVISYAPLVAKRWSPKSQHPIRLRVCVVGGDKLHQINERKTHPLMEDGGENHVIKNMKMNRFWDAVWAHRSSCSHFHSTFLKLCSVISKY